MNTSTPSSSAGPSATINSRKERGAIAAQACENCRQRKQRCSEERPKCASCVRMKLDCKYREPQPTNLERKVDELSIRGTAPSSQFEPLPRHPHQTHGSDSLSAEPSRSNSWPPTSTANPHASLRRNTSSKSHYEYVSGAYKMLTWPFVQRLFETMQFDSSQINFASLQKDGLAIMMGLRPGPPPLSTDTFGTQILESLGPSISGHQEMTFGPIDLSWETISRQSKAYFDTFNLLYPVVDRQSFQTRILPMVTNHGFDEGMESTLALLVLSLGEVAIAGTEGEPLVIFRGHPSGVKGGSPGRPPGSQLFNEARKRMGFNLTDFSLENVQLFVLASLYYGSCCLHTEFWRMTSSASLACQALLTSNPEELKSPRADLARRLFWHCLIMETFLNLEFNVPSTGLQHLEDIVGLPDFSAGDFSEEDYISNQASHFQEHFASQIALRRLSVEFNATLSNGE
ncbi:hypothetical protein TruAng_008657 [Truncatella angustata]|nr:hypothetical protein TruAng_008657 [Truncatella angustata]